MDTTFCSFSENVSPNDGMLSIFVNKVIVMKMIFLNSSEFSFGIALANFRRLKPFFQNFAQTF
ncbi:hypothetical protein T4C_13063 [Trichinella pseudospiralis]|uniref:Uncharacterized protein n=1 Tax=Trichinella pseudospiralis TaxID=6337 RepID=A0A0V1K175_TRIPS|nr:hypothetical protein T4C_13063 [Trichinella pseudospiralis]